MRFHRCSWSWHGKKGWSPQRIAAAGRAVAKEAAKVEAARDQVALFPELAAEIQPEFETVEERQVMMDRREDHLTRTIRAERAAVWRAARGTFFAIPAIRRAGLLRLWQRLDQPAGPYDFATFLRIYSTPGVSPWTYLRKLRMMVLWNHHGYAKPPHFRDITANFQTLGRVTHASLRRQNMLSVAILRGVSLRVVQEEFAARVRAIQNEL